MWVKQESKNENEILYQGFCDHCGKESTIYRAARSMGPPNFGSYATGYNHTNPFTCISNLREDVESIKKFLQLKVE